MHGHQLVGREYVSQEGGHCLRVLAAAVVDDEQRTALGEHLDVVRERHGGAPGWSGGGAPGGLRPMVRPWWSLNPRQPTPEHGVRLNYYRRMMRPVLASTTRRLKHLAHVCSTA